MKFVKPLRLDEIAAHIGGTVHSAAFASQVLEGLSALDDANPHEVSYCLDKYARLLDTCKAGALILTEETASKWQGPSIVVKNPYLAYAHLTHLCVEKSIQSGIHPSACVHPSANIHPTAEIGPFVAIAEHCTVGEHAVIDAGTVLYDHVSIGSNTHIYANVTIYAESVIGSRAIVHSHAVIGSDGFGFAEDKGQWVKIAQLGNVIIEDDVEIGAGTTIDRGALKPTHIHRGVKLDNQIQVAHNVEIGEHTAIAGQAGIAGSTKIGKFCQIGGGTGVGGHISLCDHTYITGMSMVTRSIRKPGLYSSGIPARPNALWRRNVARFQRLGLTSQTKEEDE